MQFAEPDHTNRSRAEAFGAAAAAYDRYRPRYPRALIAGLLAGGGTRALDVGAGTGVAAAQLIELGAEVLAVEPDSRMSQVAAAKGIAVEQAKFEDWDPAGRTFDLVVFAQSFHWIEPHRGLDKVASILAPGGRLALLWNRIHPVDPPQADLNTVYAEHSDGPPLHGTPVQRDDDAIAVIGGYGFDVEQRNTVEQLHYPTEDWVNLVCTYSKVLTMPEAVRRMFREHLARRIGTAGVRATNDAIALVCTAK